MESDSEPRIAYKLSIIALKYVPIVSALLMLVHVGLLLTGSTYCFAELTILTLVSIMTVIWSVSFKFCMIHKLSIAYTITVLWCIYIQRFIGFGGLLEPLRIIMFYLGLLLFIGICSKIKFNKFKL